MPNLVVDASVAIKWLNPTEPLAEQANAIRDAYVQGQVSFIVPMFAVSSYFRSIPGKNIAFDFPSVT